MNNISIRHSPFQSGPSSFLLGSKAAVDYARDYALIRSETPLSTCSSYQRHAVQLARCRVSPLRSSEIQLISLHPLHLQKIILDRTPQNSFSPERGLSSKKFKSQNSILDEDPLESFAISTLAITNTRSAKNLEILFFQLELSPPPNRDPVRKRLENGSTCIPCVV